MTWTTLDGEKVFTLSEFLSPEECRAFIALSESIGFGEATVGGEVVKIYRDNDRVMFDDPALAERLFQRAKPFLPATIKGRELVGFNERWRFYRYDPGQSFKPHFDGSYHRLERFEASELTFLIYLNDDFEGGSTNFYFDMDLHLKLGGIPRLKVQPVQGQALVFVHRQLHEGSPVKSGRKYVLRTDVMYGQPKKPYSY